MLIDEYIKKERITKALFARDFKVSRQLVGYWIKEGFHIEYKDIIKITPEKRTVIKEGQ